ncbi:hypothetical protein [Streptacidiphilus melanogenes]|uniref:hypothetical protein n=1 Tax=Streptacidiphilus melanogenes TaxID=411235 RepID=UPI0005A6EBCD|nr:hypothetical protein [Streptacidiphilus melanogenes]
MCDDWYNITGLAGGDRPDERMRVRPAPGTAKWLRPPLESLLFPKDVSAARRRSGPGRAGRREGLVRGHWSL